MSIMRDHRARFAVTGVAMTLLHLAVFRLLSGHVLAEVANATAFVVATQVNFLASYHWTWASRRAGVREPLRAVARRALLFNASVLVAFGANSLAFWAAHRLFGASGTASVLLATVVSAAVSYLVSSRLVFARRVLAVAAPAAAVPVAGPLVLDEPTEVALPHRGSPAASRPPEAPVRA
ncbi:GtrA family protein [Quadrisphaera setariae]|uniref:GtrA family protein n=1 Tax=Quadrisphaera setariae TaxID=2593304 RepID=A0A5C8ZF74_9ACTN|nr:GtrA family protein [Quadrisphaera setariae]TXR56134.1 GtrA family protein [Quadrisphaera setariae]